MSRDSLMRSCPKFISCSAPICPLDRDWHLRVMTNDDAICQFLRDWSKVLSGRITEDEFQWGIPQQVVDLVPVVYPDLLCSYTPLKKALKRISKSGSKRRLLRSKFKPVMVGN